MTLDEEAPLLLRGRGVGVRVRPPQTSTTHIRRNHMETECPECAGTVSIASPEKGEIVECPECGVELEVVSVSPPSLALAPEEEEDWGE
jgi:alpha-aminoadipate/glutamate carrier protein LysW